MATKPQETKQTAVAATEDDPKPATKPQHSKEELLAIFDELVFSDYYEEDVPLREGKLKVRFRSRSASDTVAISRDIDGKSFTLITTLQEHRALLNLGYSLVSYAGKDLTKVSPEDRISFVKAKPAAVIGLLSEALNKFDAKVDAACQEGEANF